VCAENWLIYPRDQNAMTYDGLVWSALILVTYRCYGRNMRTWENILQIQLLTGFEHTTWRFSTQCQNHYNNNNNNNNNNKILDNLLFNWSYSKALYIKT